MAGGKLFKAPYITGILLVSLLLVILYLFSAFPDVVEQVYSEAMFPWLAAALRAVFGFVPVSAGDIGYGLLIAWFIWGIFSFIKALFQRRFPAALRIIAKGFLVFLSLILVFYAFWGMNYFRQPTARLLNLQDTAYSFADIEKVSSRMIDSLNACRARLQPADIKTDEKAVFAVADHAVRQLNAISPVLYGWRPSIKKSMISPLLNYMGTSGYNNPFTGEAQLNTLMPLFEQPVTACHEMAHQLGFAREDEANFIGFLAGSRSSDRLLRYSAYYLATQELLYYFDLRDTLAKAGFDAQLSPLVKADFKTDSLYWAHYQGKLNRWTGRFYNSFLKVNKQPAGLRTYNRMIILLVAWYRKEGV